MSDAPNIQLQAKPKSKEAVLPEDLDYASDCRAAFLEEKMPFANILIFSIIGFIICFVVWAAYADVNEVTRGHGKVIPAGSNQIVQSLEGGILSEIYVSEGQTVEKGQILLRIKDTLFAANFRESQSERDTLDAQLARWEAEASGAESIAFPKHILDTRPDLVASESMLFETRRDSLASNERSLSKSLELKTKELGITKPLAETGIVSQVEVLRLETMVNDLEGNLRRARADYMSEVVTRRNDAKAKLELVNQTIQAYEDKVTRAVIRSPVYGTVNKTHIKTVGGVIQPGAPIVEIVPLDGTLLVEANISPSDIAFIRPNQTATVKLTAYDFSIYGGLEGVVEHISADTLANAKGDSFYQIRVRTGARSLKTNSQEMEVLPGMVVEVDILTGKKTVLEYLLKPLFRAKMNAMTER